MRILCFSCRCSSSVKLQEQPQKLHRTTRRRTRKFQNQHRYHRSKIALENYKSRVFNFPSRFETTDRKLREYFIDTFAPGSPLFARRKIIVARVDRSPGALSRREIATGTRSILRAHRPIRQDLLCRRATRRTNDSQRRNDNI